jgi:hypothetical protein
MTTPLTGCCLSKMWCSGPRGRCTGTSPPTSSHSAYLCRCCCCGFTRFSHHSLPSQGHPFRPSSEGCHRPRPRRADGPHGSPLGGRCVQHRHSHASPPPPTHTHTPSGGPDNDGILSHPASLHRSTCPSPLQRQPSQPTFGGQDCSVPMLPRAWTCQWATVPSTTCIALMDTSWRVGGPPRLAPMPPSALATPCRP